MGRGCAAAGGQRAAGWQVLSHSPTDLSSPLLPSPQDGYFLNDPRSGAHQWRELLKPVVGGLSLEADVSQVAEVRQGAASVAWGVVEEGTRAVGQLKLGAFSSTPRHPACLHPALSRWTAVQPGICAARDRERPHRCVPGVAGGGRRHAGGRPAAGLSELRPAAGLVFQMPRDKPDIIMYTSEPVTCDLQGLAVVWVGSGRVGAGAGARCRGGNADMREQLAPSHAQELPTAYSMVGGEKSQPTTMQGALLPSALRRPSAQQQHAQRAGLLSRTASSFGSDATLLHYFSAALQPREPITRSVRARGFVALQLRSAPACSRRHATLDDRCDISATCQRPGSGRTDQFGSAGHPAPGGSGGATRGGRCLAAIQGKQALSAASLCGEQPPAWLGSIIPQRPQTL